MPVALLPPVSSSGGPWHGQKPLYSAPRYVRGRGNSRWHRPRSAAVWPDGRTIYAFWCGPSGTDGGKYGTIQLVDELPAAEPVCGTCVGRALGSGQEEIPAGLPNLRFDPRWLIEPRLCPGSRSRTLWTPVDRVGRCLACGDLVPVRVVGRGYSAWGAGPVNHPPGKGMVDPCPFHAWQRLVERVGRAVCSCGWPGEMS